MRTLMALFAALLVGLNTLAHGGTLLAVALLKALLPRAWRTGPDRWLVALAERWIAVNSALIDRFTRTRFVIEGGEGLRYDARYLVLSNHRSWVDIPVLQKVLNRRIPFLRFFLKHTLFWVPLLGLCWWALDFPFMRRHTREQIARRPELTGRDLEATRKACPSGSCTRSKVCTCTPPPSACGSTALNRRYWACPSNTTAGSRDTRRMPSGSACCTAWRMKFCALRSSSSPWAYRSPRAIARLPATSALPSMVNSSPSNTSANSTSSRVKPTLRDFMAWPLRWYGFAASGY